MRKYIILLLLIANVYSDELKFTISKEQIDATFSDISKLFNDMCPLQIDEYTKTISVEYSDLVLTYNYQVDEEKFKKDAEGFEGLTYFEFMKDEINYVLKALCIDPYSLTDRITYLFHYYNFDEKLINAIKVDASYCDELLKDNSEED